VPSLFDGYLDDPAALAAAFREGLLRTGDLARAEPDGSFSFIARMGDSLRLGGFLVEPSKIEAHVQTHACVQACQVVGVDVERGTVPVAFVIAKREERISARALDEHCRHALARYKVPVRFIELEAFPVTSSANGEKIQRVRLRELARAQLSGA
jgi:fatty-acyl-CoA synthase